MGIIGRTNAGGGGKPAAMILVNYVADTEISCTNSSGRKDISDTKAIFYVSSVPASCVVTMRGGGRTVQQTVSFLSTDAGVSKSITMSFAYYIVQAGVPALTMTAEGKRYNSNTPIAFVPTGTQGSGVYSISLQYGSQYRGGIWYSPVIDSELSNYNNLHVVVKRTASNANNHVNIGIYTNSTTYAADGFVNSMNVDFVNGVDSDYVTLDIPLTATQAENVRFCIALRSGNTAAAVTSADIVEVALTNV